MDLSYHLPEKYGYAHPGYQKVCALSAAGDGTLQSRLQMVLSHKRAVEERIAELQGYLEHINHKASYYEQACREGTEEGLKKKRARCGLKREAIASLFSIILIFVPGVVEPRILTALLQKALRACPLRKCLPR